MPESFQSWRSLFKTTYALVLFEANLGQAKLATLAYGSDLSPRKLFRQVTDGLPSGEEGMVLLKSLPVSFW